MSTGALIGLGLLAGAGILVLVGLFVEALVWTVRALERWL